MAARVCVSVVCAPYWTESGRGDGRRDGQGDVEKDDHQSYMRPHMIGKTRGKEEDHFASFTLYRKRSRNNFVTDKLMHTIGHRVAPTLGDRFVLHAHYKRGRYLEKKKTMSLNLNYRIYCMLSIC